MKSSKTLIVIMIVSVLFFVATTGILISMSSIDQLTENSTTLLKATVIDVVIDDTGKNISAEIITKEYNSKLYISPNVCNNINLEKIRSLKKGQSVFFRIENKTAEQMGEVKFVSVVSLKTDTKDIFSLKEYNGYIHDSAFLARIATIMVAFISFCVSLYCFLLIRRNRIGATGT